MTAKSSEADTHCAEHGERTIIGYDKTETLEFGRPTLRVRVLESGESQLGLTGCMK